MFQNRDSLKVSQSLTSNTYLLDFFFHPSVQLVCALLDDFMQLYINVLGLKKSQF